MIYDVIVIGGGPAGLAAAIEAKKTGCGKVLVVERDIEPGGILQQCIHNGFGLHIFREELTGPEYAQRFISMAEETGIEFMLDTMVLKISTPSDVSRVSGSGKNCLNSNSGAPCKPRQNNSEKYSTPEIISPSLPAAELKSVVVLGSSTGMQTLHCRSIVLAMGCRERTRGAIAIPGSRPAGIFTAGTAQRFINIEGYMVGKKILILGSGDIGLIMARRLALEGAEVKGVVEVMPYSNGLSRNIVQCLEHYGIPLYLGHTVTNIHGKEKIERITVSKVDENRNPVKGTEIDFECDTLLLSVGLIPENELSREAGIELDKRTGGLIVNEKMETSVKGIFACGNVVHVHDLVDFVTDESRKAGCFAGKNAVEKKSECGRETESKNGADRELSPAMTTEQGGPGAEGFLPAADTEGTDEAYMDFKPGLVISSGGCIRGKNSPLQNEALSSIEDAQSLESSSWIRITNGEGISYTVPQKIETSGKDIDVFMRVNRVFKNRKLSVKSEGKRVFSVDKKNLLPGEMIKLTIPGNVFDIKGEEKTIQISVE